LKRDQLRSVELAPDLKGRTRDDERPVHVVTVGSIYVVEKGSVFVLVAVNGQGDLTALQESADLLEAGVRQFQEWGNCDQGRHILTAVARYLAAHFPTQRALLQTADIASRLTRGGELHREAEAAG